MDRVGNIACKRGETGRARHLRAITEDVAAAVTDPTGCVPVGSAAPRGGPSSLEWAVAEALTVDLGAGVDPDGFP